MKKNDFKDHTLLSIWHAVLRLVKCTRPPWNNDLTTTNLKYLKAYFMEARNLVKSPIGRSIFLIRNYLSRNLRASLPTQIFNHTLFSFQSLFCVFLNYNFAFSNSFWELFIEFCSMLLALHHYYSHCVFVQNYVLSH